MDQQKLVVIVSMFILVILFACVVALLMQITGWNAGTSSATVITVTTLGVIAVVASLKPPAV
jgi:hypothetical protein